MAPLNRQKAADTEPVRASLAALQKANPPACAPSNLHEQLLAAFPHPVLLLETNDTIAYVNTAGEHFFGMSETMLKRQQLPELLGASSPLVALAAQVRRSGITVNEYGIALDLPRSATTRLVDAYGGPLPERPGAMLLMLQQRAMAQMIERQFTHRAAARSVSGLAAILAHEIKNPLSGIRGAAQLIEPALGPDDRILARLICDETDRIRDLVDRMEVFGDERPLDKEPVNVHAVLDHVRRLAENGFGAHARFVEDYDPSLPLVPANRDKLVQAFLNLTKNAAEALEDGPREEGRIILRTGFRPGVRLFVPGAGSRVSLPFMIEIEDNGPGVPETIKDQLFDPFVTSKRTGTGLGLALVAKIIGDHGGIIECDSLPGRTIFRVLLPIGSAIAGHSRSELLDEEY